QIGPAVDRLDIGDAGVGPDSSDLLAIEPELGVSAGLRQEMIADRPSRLLDYRIVATLVGCRRGHDVAVDVAARAERRRKAVIDRPNDRPQVVLEDPVELDALAGGQTERVVALFAGQAIERQPQLGVNVATGEPEPDHEAERVFLTGLAAIVTEVAIVLLIAPMELQDLVARIRDVCRRRCELLEERGPEARALLLEDFDAGPLVGRPGHGKFLRPP